MDGHAGGTGAVGVVLPEGAGESGGGGFDLQELPHADDGIDGLTLVGFRRTRRCGSLPCLLAGGVRERDRRPRRYRGCRKDGRPGR